MKEESIGGPIKLFFILGGICLLMIYSYKNHTPEVIKSKPKKIMSVTEERQAAFSKTNGRHYMLCYRVKEKCHDPGSFEHVRTVTYDKDGKIYISMTFRAKNAFGAYRLQRINAVANERGLLLAVGR